MSQIDLQKLKVRCLDDNDFVGQMLQIFCEAAPRTFLALEAAVKAGNTTEARRHAHTLKGSAGNISADLLRTAAADAEALAEHGDTAGLEKAVARVGMLLNRSVAEAEAAAKAIRG